MYGDRWLTPAEIDLVEDFELLDRFGDTSVLRNALGHKIPEMVEGAFAMAEYKAIAQQRHAEIKSGKKQWFDIG